MSTLKIITKGSSILMLMSVLSITHAEEAETGLMNFEIEENELPFDIVLSGRFGWDWAKVGKDTHVKLLTIDPVPDLFKTSKEWSTQPVGGGFIGVEFPILYRDEIHWQTGVAYYQASSFDTNGVDYFLSEPDFGDRAYKYSIKNQRVLWENKFLYGFMDYFWGYFLVGVGNSFNEAYGYEERSLESHTPANGQFASHRKNSVTYSLGVGLETTLTEFFRFGIGYQFSDLGRVSLGNYNNGNTTNTIGTSTIPTNELIMELSFIY